MTRFLLLVAIIQTCIRILASETCLKHKSLEESGNLLLTKIIPCEYMKELLPPRKISEPVEVEFNIVIQDINSISAANMDFRVDMFIHMSWVDSRLSLDTLSEVEMMSNFITLPANAIEHIWTPDPYITKSKDGDITSLTKEFASITLYTNSSLRYSARVFSVIGCQMEFHQYPMDIQNCSINIQSFMYNSKDVLFRWRSWSPIIIIKDLELLQFSLTKPLPNYTVEVSGPEHGVPDRKTQALVVLLEFRREIGHHIVQTFVPSFLLVSLSWFSFWLGLDAVPGRVTLVVTSFLTLTTIFIGIQDNLPPAAYVKAIDVWMGGCMFFIFAAIGEFALVKVIRDVQQKNRIIPHNNNDTVEPQQMQAANHPDRPSNMGGNSLKFITIHPHQHPVNNEEKMKYEHFNNKNVYNINNPNGSHLANHLMTHSRTPSTNNLIIWDQETSSAPEPNAMLQKSLAPVGDPEGQHPEKLQNSRYVTFRKLDYKPKEEKVLWEQIDKLSRIVFPLTFLLFACIYFPILISRSF